MRLTRPVVATFLFAMSAALLLLGALTASLWVGLGGLAAGVAGVVWLYRIAPARPIRPARPAPQVPGPTMDEIHAAENAGRNGSAWVVDSEVRSEFGTTGKYELLSHVIVKLPDQPEYQTIIREFGYPTHHARHAGTVVPIVQLAEGEPEVAVRDGVLDPDTPRAEFGYPRFWTSLYDDAAFDSASLSGSVLPLIPRESFTGSSKREFDPSPVLRKTTVAGVSAVAALVGAGAAMGIALDRTDIVATAIEARSEGADNLTRNGELLQERVDDWAERTDSTRLCHLYIKHDALVLQNEKEGEPRLSVDLHTSTVTMMKVKTSIDETEECDSVHTQTSDIDLSIVPQLVEQSTQRHAGTSRDSGSNNEWNDLTVRLDLERAPRHSWEHIEREQRGTARPAYWVVNVDSAVGNTDTYSMDGTYLPNDPLRLNE